MRRATALGEAGRELRVVLVSDAVASAGYKRPSRLAAEVADATRAATSAAVLTVPVGSDADRDTLAEIARGGGGVLVPYAPGERTSEVALALAGAGAGELLRDVSVELPPGLDAMAPRELPTLRASGETYVVAKMSDAHVHGDVVLRGTAGGEPFEKRYALDVSATSDAGNAFVPRLFAQARIRNLERDGTDSAKTEAVALSEKLAVPSRFTSLLVLESDAMFRAFGIDRNASAPRWTGETIANQFDVATATGKDSVAEEPSGTAGNLLANGGGRGGGGTGEATAETRTMGSMPAAAATATAVPSLAPPAPPEHASRRFEQPLDRARPDWRFRRPGRFMRRVFHREATIATTSGTFVDGVDRVTTARRALDAAPDDRAKHRNLARALFRRGAIDELAQVLVDWQRRDPFDADAIALRSEVLAARGDRAAAARVLSGVAVSANPAGLDQLALGSERAGDDDQACSLRIAAAETTPDDATRVAHAVRCERASGRTTAADRWLNEAGARRGAVETVLSSLSRGEGSASGDIVLDATWSGGADVDLAVMIRAGNASGGSPVADASTIRPRARTNGSACRAGPSAPSSSRSRGATRRSSPSLASSRSVRSGCRSAFRSCSVGRAHASHVSTRGG